MANETALAIVREEETALDRPRRWWQRKPVPRKTRHFVEVEAPIVPHRPGEAPDAAHLTAVAEDLSWKRLVDDAEGWKFKIIGWSWLALIAAGAALGGAALPPFGILEIVIGALIGVDLGLPLILVPISTMLNEGRIKKVLDGRLDESAEIAAGVENLGLMANGVDVFGASVVRLPVESLFRALGHDDPDVRQFASELIAKLPGQVQTDAVIAFAKHLTAEQLALVPGCSLPPTLAIAHDKDRVEWPKALVTMTRSDSK